MKGGRGNRKDQRKGRCSGGQRTPGPASRKVPEGEGRRLRVPSRQELEGQEEAHPGQGLQCGEGETS